MSESVITAIGPHQLNKIDDTHATVRYPPTETTVLSMQPDGRLELRAAGTCGPYELALIKGDRLVYAPEGVEGAVYLLPFASELP